MNKLGLAIVAVGLMVIFAPVLGLSGVGAGTWQVGHADWTTTCGSTTYVGQWYFDQISGPDQSVTWGSAIVFSNGTQTVAGKLSNTILGSGDCFNGVQLATLGQALAWNSGGPDPYCTGYSYCAGSVTTTTQSTATTQPTTTTAATGTDSGSTSSKISSSGPPLTVEVAGVAIIGVGAFVTFRKKSR